MIECRIGFLRCFLSGGGNTKTMFAINATAAQPFLDALQCQSQPCRFDESEIVSLCNTNNIARFWFVRCDDPAGPVLSIENVTLKGTINGTLFKAMGDVWVGLNLINTSLSGTIPPELFQSTNLLYLLVTNNSLSGSLPSEPIATSMLDLRVNKNRLGGTIPSAYLTNMPSIVRLHFGENEFSGTLPVVSAFPSRLDTVFFNNNDLSGTLPAVLSTWSNPRKLFSVASNQLSGTLPAGLFSNNASQFVFFRVDDNQLSGNVPFELVRQSSLTRLNLTHNAFGGALTLPALPTASQCAVAFNMFVTCSQAGAMSCCDRFDATPASTIIPITTTTLTSPVSGTVTTSSPTIAVSMTNQSSTFAALSSASAVSSPLPPTPATVLIGGIVGGILALMLFLALVGIVIFYRLRRTRTTTVTPSSHATSEYGVLPAQDRTYGDVEDVRAPRNEYEATDTPLRA
jgi:hypothetical protein